MRNKGMFFYLTLIALFAGVMIFVRQFILYNVPEFFDHGYALGEIVFNVSIGFLVTYWFYYLTIHRREKQYREKAYSLVKDRAEKISKYTASLKRDIFKYNEAIFTSIGLKMDNPYNYGQVLKFIDPNSHSGTFNAAFQPVTWNNRIIKVNHSIKESIKDIFIVIPYLEAEDIELFTKLYSSEYLELTDNLDFSQFSDLEFMGIPMFEFYELTKQIDLRFEMKKD